MVLCASCVSESFVSSVAFAATAVIVVVGSDAMVGSMSVAVASVAGSSPVSPEVLWLLPW